MELMLVLNKLRKQHKKYKISKRKSATTMPSRRENKNAALSRISDIVEVTATRNDRFAQGSEGALSKWAVNLIDEHQDIMRANGENLAKDKESLRAVEYIATSPSLKEALVLGDRIADMRRSAKTDAERVAIAAKEDELSDKLSAAYDQIIESGDEKQRAAYDAAESYIINATVIGVEGAQALDDMRGQAAGVFRNLLEKKEAEPDTTQEQQLTEAVPPVETGRMQGGLEDKPKVLERPITARIRQAVGDMRVFLGETAKSTKENLSFAANMMQGTIANFLAIRSENYDDPAEYRRAKIKATKNMIGTTGILAFGAVAAIEAVKWYSMISPAARAVGIAAEGAEDYDLPQNGMSDSFHHDSVMGVDDNMSLGMLHRHPEYAANIDAEQVVYSGAEVYGGTELLPYDINTDPYNADKLDVFNMSDGFTSENIASSLAEWKSDVVKSPEMMAMLLDQYGDIDPTLLDDDLSNNAELFSAAQRQVVDIINGMEDVHYVTVPAGTEYSSYYTFMDENGNFQLGRSFGVSHDYDLTFMVGTITDAFGNEKQIMINTECGQICSFEPTIGSDYVPVVPRTPLDSPTSDTPLQPSPESPAPPTDTDTPTPETPTPPTDTGTPPEPSTPEETPSPNPEPKNSAQNIDENPQLDQAIANGGEKHDSGEYISPEQMVQPEEEYAPAENDSEQSLAPGAEPITAVEQELRKKLSNEGGESDGRI